MLQWFTEQDPVVKAAIIALCGTVLAALIAGIFSLLAKKEKDKANPTYTVKQTATGNNNTQIGIQNNFKRDE